MPKDTDDSLENSAPEVEEMAQAEPTKSTEKEQTYSQRVLHRTVPKSNVSKSRIKQDIMTVTKLGERLIKLKPQVLETLPISRKSLKALLEAQKITHHTGRKRQIKFIGKLLRDENVEDIMEIIKKQEQPHIAEIHLQKICGMWRERLLKLGDEAVFDIAAKYPTMDTQQLRQLVRKSQKEISEQQQPPKSQKELFRYLREHLKDNT